VAVGVLAIVTVHVAGLARGRPSRAHVADLLLAARERSDPARLRELVARAVGDPGAAVYWWDRDSGSYVDHAGRAGLAGPVAADIPAAHIMEVESDHRPIARVVGQRPLVDDPAILGPVAEALRLSTENRLLQEELAASLVQVRESRSRIVQASDEARRRIERDLHDGAQQLLISTGAKLNLASARVDAAHDPDLADALTQASDELGRALTELRSLARGITPTALVHGSLADALEDLALRSPVPATLQVVGTAPVQPEVAATAYFVVAECLANVAKHAHASAVHVSVELGDPLRVVVRDDGLGGADPTAGSGLKGLADRVEAQGGTLEVSSTPGTTVTATLPNAAS
jgi:signal transduction histidine kinase